MPSSVRLLGATIGSKSDVLLDSWRDGFHAVRALDLNEPAIHFAKGRQFPITHKEATMTAYQKRIGSTLKALRNGFHLPSFVFILAACALTGGCTTTMTLEDRRAPSAQLDLEYDYEMGRIGAERLTGTHSPPAIKASGEAISGVGVRLRTRLSNTFTWTELEGTSTFDIAGVVSDQDALKGDGFVYQGRLLLMPGFSFMGDRLFIAGLIGLDGTHVNLQVYEVETEQRIDMFDSQGYMGIPIGAHLECTIGRTITPFFTMMSIVPVESWGGDFEPLRRFTSRFGVRLWPGSMIGALGSHLWIEGGHLWTHYGTTIVTGIINVATDINIDGPYAGIGLIF